MSGARPATLRLTIDGALVADARVARGPVQRGRGLIGTRELVAPDALLIPRCSSVHTFFMSIAIDLVYVTKDFEVVKVVGQLRPWRFSLGGRRAAQVLELPAGVAARLGITRGRLLDVEEIPAGPPC